MAMKLYFPNFLLRGDARLYESAANETRTLS